MFVCPIPTGGAEIKCAIRADSFLSAILSALALSLSKGRRWKPEGRQYDGRLDGARRGEGGMRILLLLCEVVKCYSLLCVARYAGRSRVATKHEHILQRSLW